MRNLDNYELDMVNGGSEKSAGAKIVEIPAVVAEAVVGFVVGVLEAWTDDK